MPPNEKAFSSIDGVKTTYIRGSSPFRATFYCTYDFYDRLVVWVRDLRKISREAGRPRGAFDRLEAIACAGAYVNRSGQHGMGTAFDLDRVWWNDRMSSPYARHHANTRRVVRRRYWAVNAITRRHFRWVLDGNYNAAHADHIHFDFGGLAPKLQTGSRSDVVFVQAVLNDFQFARLAVDGAWGPKTDTAFNKSLNALRINGDPRTTRKPYRDWLRKVARHGFGNRRF